MAALPVHVRVVQAIGITTSAALAGGAHFRHTLTSTHADPKLGSILSISFVCVPALLAAPEALAFRQWQILYRNGMIRAIPATLMSASCLAYLSYALYKTLHHPRAEIYGLAACCTIAIMPYTLLIMSGVNGTLTKKAKESQEWSATDEAVKKNVPTGESSKELLDRWTTHNTTRGIFALLGATCAAWATFK